MKPGKRVNLLSLLARRLAEREWREIDLILRQFGFRWSSEWRGEGGREDYCLECLEGGEDSALEQLREYLLDVGDAAVVGEAEHLWKPGHFRLFMSHVSKKKSLVSAVKKELEGYGIDGFVAHKDISPTKEWVGEIERALSTCDALAAFLTDGFHESHWTDQEVGYCVSRRVLVVPIRMDMDPYGLIARYQALTIDKEAPDKIAKDLATVLSTNDLTTQKMAPAILRCFEDSESYAEAKSRLTGVESIRAWTPEMLRSLEGALEKNSQIRGSWGVPDRVRAILRKHSQ